MSENIYTYELTKDLIIATNEPLTDEEFKALKENHEVVIPLMVKTGAVKIDLNEVLPRS